MVARTLLVPLAGVVQVTAPPPTVVKKKLISQASFFVVVTAGHVGDVDVATAELKTFTSPTPRSTAYIYRALEFTVSAGKVSLATVSLLLHT